MKAPRLPAPDDAEPATRGEIRELAKRLGLAIDAAEVAQSYASESVSEMETVKREVRELQERVDEAIDFFLEVYRWWRGPNADAEPAEDTTAIRLDRYATAYLENREPDGTPPTQSRLAEALDVSDRWIRVVGWTNIQARAAELEAGTGTPP